MFPFSWLRSSFICHYEVSMKKQVECYLIKNMAMKNQRKNKDLLNFYN